MIIQVVLKLCHALIGSDVEVCREEIALETDMSMQSCIMSQAALADWQSKSMFPAPEWRIAGIKCSPGTSYVIKERV